MDERKKKKILNNAKTSMEIEGFTINEELEEIGRKILSGEISITVYVNQCKQKAARLQANEI